MSDTKEQVNHPSHYLRGGLEAIDVIEAFGLDFCLGNAVKYVLRAGHKDDALVDLKKAAWYLNRAVERLEKERAKSAGVATRHTIVDELPGDDRCWG